ncbi:MAG: DUF3099 domain-containing protein [Corynebacteriales bacterium]|nr:DUF3099 domain-containing protein [Mycobacteriales bacterium]
MSVEKHVITDAPPSPQEQLRGRQMRYLIMMGLRIACLIAAAVVVIVDAPYALAWVGVCIAGMVLFPWMAVLVANDRPPRKKTESHRLWRRQERLSLTNNKPK